MAFTTQQIQGLDAAYARQQAGTENKMDTDNLKYAQGLGYKPTAPAAPAAPPPAAAPEAKPAPVLDASTGTVKASSALDFYNSRMDAMKPQYEQATQDLTKIQSDIASMKPIDYGASYGQMYQAQVAPIDANITTVSQKLTTLDDSLRKMEDDVRAEIGGRAPESVIQAEVARRSKPLLLERQTFADQLQNYQDQKTQIDAQINKQLGFQQQSYTDQLALMDKKAEFAKSTVETYNSLVGQYDELVQRGGEADKESMALFADSFKSQLSKMPSDFWASLSERDLADLKSGNVTTEVMRKLGQFQTASDKLFGSSDTGYYERQADGTYKQVIPSAGGGSLSSSSYQLIQDKDTGTWYRVNKATGQTEPIPFGEQAGEIGAFMEGIAKMESGGNYQAVGPKTKNGDRAYGKYQVMGANIPSWTKEALGQSLTVQQFVSSPEAQDAVAKYKMQQAYDKYGTWEDAASVWFSGRPLSKAGNAKDVLGTSVPQYVNNIMATMRQTQKQTQPTAAPATSVKLTAAQQDEMSTLDTVKDLANQVLSYNADGKLEGVGGFYQGSLGQFLTTNFGYGSEEAKRVRALLGNIKATIAKMRGGTSFTANEEALLNTYTPTINESPESALTKLNLLMDFIDSKKRKVIEAASGQTTQQGATSNTESYRQKYNY